MRVLRTEFKPESFDRGSSHLSVRALRTFWTGSDADSKVSTQGPREEEEKKTMARRKLSLEQQLKGVRAAIRSKRTPPQLRDGLRRRAEWLSRELGKSGPTKGRKKPSFRIFG
jgi:hypothetical protein